MQTYLWNPWSMFDEFECAMFSAPGSPEWPVFDIEDADDATTLTADLPGMTEDDIDVMVAGSMLTVRGERKAKDGRYLERRRFRGAFEQQFRLGDGYDLDAVSAHLASGVLTITLAKAAKAKPRRIKLAPRLGTGHVTGLATGVVDKLKGLFAGDKDKKQAA